MHLRAFSATPLGVDAAIVEVEADISGGLPSFTTVGLAEAAVREARVRVQTAITNAGYVFPAGRISVNLAPAHVRKDGTGLDLAVALALLAADRVIAPDRLEGVLILGELSLSGGLRPVRGVLAAVEAARQLGLRRVLVPPANGPEAALASRMKVHCPASLEDAVSFLTTGDEAYAPRAARRARAARPVGPDLREVRGQSAAKRALEIAAAGAHNLLMSGPPGAGKTMLARRLPGILPPLTEDEALEVTRIQSAAGLNIGEGLACERPFRAPHHSTTPSGLVGGGAGIPRAGEISLAHRGVLFLDELPEFARATLEALRQPLESGEVVLSRANATVRYPAAAMLVAAMNPCPCGMLGSGRGRCRCAPQTVERYRSRLSGPLLDRIDMHVHVAAVEPGRLADAPTGEATRAVRRRVRAARDRQWARAGQANAHLAVGALHQACALDDESQRLLLVAADRLGLSARGHDRVLRIARTIADLAGVEAVTADHVAEALQYRTVSTATAQAA